MLLAFLSISTLPSCHLWNPRYQPLEDKVSWTLGLGPVIPFSVPSASSTLFHGCCSQEYPYYSTFSSPIFGEQQIQLCITPGCPTSSNTKKLIHSYTPEICFACVLLCWTQWGSGCLLKFPVGTTDCNPETCLPFKKAVCTSSSRRAWSVAD